LAIRSELLVFLVHKGKTNCKQHADIEERKNESPEKEMIEKRITPICIRKRSKPSELKKKGKGHRGGGTEPKRNSRRESKSLV